MKNSKEVSFFAEEASALIKQFRKLKEDDKKYGDWELFGALASLLLLGVQSFLLALGIAMITESTSKVELAKSSLLYGTPICLLAITVAGYAYYKGRSLRYDLAKLEFLITLSRILQADSIKNVFFEGDLSKMPHDYETMKKAWAKPFQRSEKTYVLQRDWCKLRGEIQAPIECSISTNTKLEFAVRDVSMSSTSKSINVWMIASLLQQSTVEIKVDSKASSREKIESAIEFSDLTLNGADVQGATTCWHLQTEQGEQMLEKPYKQLHTDRNLSPEVLARILKTLHE